MIVGIVGCGAIANTIVNERNEQQETSNLNYQSAKSIL